MLAEKRIGGDQTGWSFSRYLVEQIGAKAEPGFGASLLGHLAKAFGPTGAESIFSEGLGV